MSYNYTDPISISFQPGFHYKPANTDVYLNARIDHNIIVNNTYGNEIDPDTRTLDYTLPVGTIEGKSDVALTGAMTYTIPIFTPPGVAGLVPSVSLNYNSQLKNGLAGIGWNLSGASSISRVPQTIYYDHQSHPVDFSSSDRFSLDGQRLLITNTANYGDDGSEYLTEVFNGSKVILHKDTEGYVWFECISQDNLIMEYGHSEDSRIEDLFGDEKNIISWNINKIKDKYGNYIKFIYKKEVVNDITSFRLSEIQYTGNEDINKEPDNKIQFLYSLRQDYKIGHQLGNNFNNNLLLKEIRVVANSQIVRKYVLDYFLEQISKLSKITEFGTDGKPFNYTGFNYGQQIPPNQTVYYELLDGSIDDEENISGLNYKYLPGDYDGDNRTDILRVAYTDIGGNEVIQRFELFINCTYFMDYTEKPSYQRKLDSKDNPDIDISKAEHIKFGDLNGDGRADIIQIDNFGTYGSPDYKFKCYFSKPIIYNTNFSVIYEDGFDKIGAIDIVEYNNDGIGDFLIYAKSSSITQYLPYILVSSTSFDLYAAVYSDVIQLSNIAKSEDQIQFGDFNGNGSTDILVQSDFLIKVYEYNLSSNSFNKIFDDLGVIGDAHFTLGDYNGDGNTDLLFYTDPWTEWFNFDPPDFVEHTYEWQFYYSNGKNFIEASSPINYLNPQKYVYIPSDYNNDAVCDILVLGPFDGQNDVGAKIFSLQGENFITESIQAPLSCNWPDSKSSYNVADINSDGQADLLAYNSSTKKLNLLYFRPHSEEHLITFIVDGYNRVTQFQYKPLTSAPFYTSSNTEEHAAESMNSVIGINIPLVGVISKTVFENYSRQTYHMTEYYYDQFFIHRFGKGLLGLRSRKTHELDRSVEITNYFDLKYIISSDKFCSFLPSKTESKILNNVTNTIDYTYGIKFLRPNNIISSRIHVPFTSTIIEQDNIKNTKSKTEIIPSDIDLFGNILKKTVKYGDNNDNYDLDFDIFITEIDPTLYNNWYPCKASRSKTITKRANDPVTYYKITDYKYYNTDRDNGTVQYVIDYPDMDKETTKTYSYDLFGNVSLITYSSKDPNVTTKTAQSIYDTKGQFIVTSINELGHSQNRIINNIGLVIIETDQNNLSSTFAYDGFGRLIKIIAPDGNVAEKIMLWNEDSQWLKCLYHIDAIKKGSPSVITYYDEFDRVIRTAVEQMDGKFLKEDKVYHSKNGTLNKVSLPYQGTSPNQYTNVGWTVYNYNNYGAIESLVFDTHQESYEYDVSARTTTIKKKDLQGNEIDLSKTLTYNYLQQLASITDNLGTVTYEYYGSGLIKNLINIDGTKITNYYDDYNRKKSTVDPNSGTIEYNYDAFGILRYEKDGSSNSYTYLYDKLNRIKTITSNTGNVVTYIYDAPGKPVGSLSEISHSNGIVYSYYYDELTRLSRETEKIDGVEYSYEYVYNEYGNISTQKYPSGLLVKNVYSDKGYLIQVFKNDDNKPLIDIPIDGINEHGQLNHYTLGNGIIVDKYFDQYRKFSGVRYGSVMNLDWDYDPLYGNLNFRKDITNPANILVETFQHLDQAKTRLNQYQVSNAPSFSVVYNPNGTIDEKSDIGQYNYGDINHPYALSKVSTYLNILSDKQDISYTDYSKVSKIVKTTGSDIVELYFTYGPEMQRKKTELMTNNIITKTKYFIGNSYEIEYKGNEVRKLNYIYGPDGLIGIYTINAKNEGEMYYIHSDHLGSWKCITDDSGNIVEKMDYDPWGRRRDPQTWQYTMKNKEYFFDRGFTGHEMLDEFQLINMNGRIFDPHLGVFISADNYVQAPENSQSFNRYSYCFNNPLTYTDPSGYWSGWDDVVVGAVGFAYGYVSYGISTGDWGWNAVQSGAVYCGLFLISYYSAGTMTQSASAVANTAKYPALSALEYSGKMLAGNIVSRVIPPINIIENDVYTVSISPNLSFGNGFGMGASISIDAKHQGWVSGLSIGFTAYDSYGATNTRFNESRVNTYFGYISKSGGFVYGINSFSGGGFDQTTASCTLIKKIGNEMASLTYENDWMFGMPGPDGGDRYRTAAFNIKYGKFGLGSNMFTGNPNEEGDLDMANRSNIVMEVEGKPLREYYNGGTANKYRLGTLYLSYENYKIGSNSENFRHVFQNRVAHDLFTSCAAKWYERLGNIFYFYSSYDTRSRYSLW
ncbi:MAG: polymorphic toxin type 23 domain-containing protein [Omnitrophica WOR_2 bacterium]